MQTVANSVERVCRYRRRAGTDCRFMLQLINKFANVQISVTKRLASFCNAVALVNNYHKDIRLFHHGKKGAVL